MSKYAAVVQAGIDYLNANHAGWIDKINFTNLNMMNDGDGACITKQVGISNNSGPHGLLLIDSRLGFVPDSCEDEPILRKQWIKSITELRKPKETVQQQKNRVFRKIVDGLIKQKLVRAMDPKTAVCKYKTADGNRCAAGQLIPDCDYTPAFESGVVDVIGTPVNKYFTKNYQTETIDMIRLCQSAHDHILSDKVETHPARGKVAWAVKMLEIYKEHKINSPVTQAKLQTIVDLEVK